MGTPRSRALNARGVANRAMQINDDSYSDEALFLRFDRQHVAKVTNFDCQAV